MTTPFWRDFSVFLCCTYVRRCAFVPFVGFFKIGFLKGSLAGLFEPNSKIFGNNLFEPYTVL